MSKTVFVLDDNQLDLFAIKTVLNAAGYIVKTFEKAKDLFDQLRVYRPALVITDLDMPDIQGEQVVATIKPLYPQLPVVVVSAHRELVQYVSFLGADAGVYKQSGYQLTLPKITHQILCAKRAAA